MVVLFLTNEGYFFSESNGKLSFLFVYAKLLIELLANLPFDQTFTLSKISFFYSGRLVYCILSIHLWMSDFGKYKHAINFFVFKIHFGALLYFLSYTCSKENNLILHLICSNSGIDGNLIQSHSCFAYLEKQR